MHTLRKGYPLLAATLLTLFSCVVPVQANDAEIVEVTISAVGDSKFRVNVTLEHADEGWDHYANRWDVLNEKGELIGSRTLHHPHVNEQPFTRSLTITIPAEVSTITIVASDSVHGDNVQTKSIAVPGR